MGIGAIADHDTENPKVVIASDRLVTTQQQSAIEHEHPETKLSKVGMYLEGTHLVAVVAGSVQFGERYLESIESGIEAFIRENEEEPWVSTVAEVAGNQYRAFVQEKIENVVLQTYGLRLDDLSRQHQFKDGFLDDLLAEADQVRQQIHQNLVLLLGGVGPQGAGVYQVTANDVIPQNDMGYATIGSGTQPAESEFIKSEYGKTDGLTKAFATVAAANHQAKKASGVGGEPDIMVVDTNGVHEVDEETSKALMERQNKIAKEQEKKRGKILEEEDINWDTGV
ncbi:MAG: hypothetical protein ABEH61_03240 [Haloarculaceae archaeon]